MLKTDLCAGDIITLPCAGDATSGESPLDLLARRSDLSILFQAALAAGDEFGKTLNGERTRVTTSGPQAVLTCGCAVHP